MTERIYENDAYCKNFEAVVMACTPVDGKYYIELDKTAFFPEGGGQDADKGTINGIDVLDVQLQGSSIVHMLEKELSVGENVNCEIDWELRYKRMQAHTGEHILSGVVNATFGYDNVGFHMGDKLMVVDFNGSLSSDDIRNIEIKANEAVYSNVDVVAYYPTIEELEKLNYRSKKEIEEAIRIVSIGKDIDCCACCAPHVSKTGEIGLIKVIDFYSYKQGTRIEMMAGKDALVDYIDMNLALKELMKLLSSPRDKVVSVVGERLSSLQDIRYEYQKISKQLALLELELTDVNNSVYTMTKGLSFDDLRYCANQLAEKEYDICMLLSKNENGGYIYVVSSKSKDVRPAVKKLNEAFSGKGGGQSSYAQGKIEEFSEDEVKSFVEKLLGEEA